MTNPDKNTTIAARIAAFIGERIISGELPPDVPLRQDLAGTALPWTTFT